MLMTIWIGILRNRSSKSCSVFFFLIKLVNTVFKVADDVIDQNEYYSLNTIIWTSIGTGAGGIPGLLVFFICQVSTFRMLSWKYDAFRSF
jgi:hypothetical protein